MKEGFSMKLIRFIALKFKDMKIASNKDIFKEYGLSMFCGPQGAGKTMAMTDYLVRMKKKYPNVMIVTNYGYKEQDRAMTTWRDLINIRNGDKGVIFAIDEIQNEYNSLDWASFPEDLLRQVTQQRKQRVKIVATSQVYTRVLKQLREQTFNVIDCHTLCGRWTFCKQFDAEEYEAVIGNPDKKIKLHRQARWNFIQEDSLRDMYDSYAVIEAMTKKKFIERKERAL